MDDIKDSDLRLSSVKKSLYDVSSNETTSADHKAAEKSRGSARERGCMDEDRLTKTQFQGRGPWWDRVLRVERRRR